MHPTVALIPFFAFITTISAVPISLHTVARSVPDINQVARNPAPIDGRVNWEDGKPSLGDTSNISKEDLKKLKDLIHHLLGERAAPDVAGIVVDRSIGDVQRPARDPVYFHV
ncbi:hypothetical protein ACJQWK_00760 [Exserohilum turcicum]|uniref:Uncharacterized protein n=1 Tax=Exserohilum turcicum (strain 28A) TaxID=671987 RepID=R0JRT9_EXST2|nr:uncharacterized protein SETTUDRAFT_32853 [Exserohilum turcica Et28A]EOA83833.1 hypothetical protein SETTUDRAFT_32853 [Exserohilum turcica Et28A]